LEKSSLENGKCRNGSPGKLQKQKDSEAKEKFQDHAVDI
jgi:hypothetical protein